MPSASPSWFLNLPNETPAASVYTAGIDPWYRPYRLFFGTFGCTAGKVRESSKTKFEVTAERLDQCDSTMVIRRYCLYLYSQEQEFVSKTSTPSLLHRHCLGQSIDRNTSKPRARNVPFASATFVGRKIVRRAQRMSVQEAICHTLDE